MSSQLKTVLHALINQDPYLDLNTIKNLARTCSTSRHFIGLVKSRFSWFTRRTNSLELERYHLKFKQTHTIIHSCTLMLECVRKGWRTLSYCTFPPRWFGQTKNNQFDLEQMLKSEWVKDINSIVCNHDWEFHDLTITDQKDQFQHYHVSQKWKVNTSVKDTSWSADSSDRYWLTQSKPIDTCLCYHCKTVGTYPSRECLCPKCSDPVTGVSYWSKLTEPF